jgi:SPP1 family predicted phage head-tail adaptor
MPEVNLDRRVTIQQRTLANNALGEAIETWSDLVASLPAQFLPISGREIFAGAERQARAVASWRIRYRSDIARTMRLVYDGATYDIADVTEDRRFDRRQYLIVTGEAEMA